MHGIIEEMQLTAYPKLPQVWKDRYPFRLACPSFVYPADYDVNVDLLGPCVDDIELLFFESRPVVRPGGALIKRLKDLGARHAVGYLVHLPTDSRLFDPDPERRQTAVDELAGLTQLLAPLQAAFAIMHLEMDGDPRPPVGGRRRWEQGIAEGLARLADAGIDLSRLMIENQSAPLEWIGPVLETFDLALCLDIGHLKLSGGELEQTLVRWQARIGALHVHGVQNGRDHQSLECLDSKDQAVLQAFLRSFRGSVCVEIFNFNDLSASLLRLAHWMG